LKVLFITHFFPPEPGAGATRMAYFVDALARAGHDVTVVTSFPSFPRGRFEGRNRAFVRVEHDGRKRTVRLFSVLVPGMPGSRLVHWLTAAFSACMYSIATRERYDMVVISSPPITVAIPGLVAAWRHRAKLVVDVRDVFPDLAVQMGVWRKDSFVVWAVERLVRQLYKRASLTVAVTPTAISQISARGVPASRLVLARNAAERFPSVGSANGSSNGFTAIYAGNLGLMTDVDVLVDAAALTADENITIQIVGDGAQNARLRERLRNEGVRNVVMKGSVARPEAMAMIRAADASIISLRKGIEESIPTKLYDSLSVGCPVVVVAEGEAKKEGASLGALCTPAGDAAALATTLRQLASLDKAALRKLGDAGKASLSRRDDRAGIMRELVARIGALA
jgi:glycosyltransferase involved in cell wall biosynthesis